MGIYIGVSGKVRQVANVIAKNGSSLNNVFVKANQQIFITSGTFIPPTGVTKVDVFLVGGGGKGGRGGEVWEGWNPATTNIGGGGGGGYTKTVKGVSVTPGKSYSIIVGDGDKVGRYSKTWGSYNDQLLQTVTRGGTSSALGYSADGGWCGDFRCWSNYSENLAGNGGSGGGGGCSVYNISSNGGVYWGAGGSDGGNGYIQSTISTASNPRGGQGSTTRAFGESSGTLYAGGGGGGQQDSNTFVSVGGSGGGGAGGQSSAYKPPVSGTEHSGGGGGGSDCKSYIFDPGVGGSGIVIIRWGT